MAFQDTMRNMQELLEQVMIDLNKVHKGNRSAAQRIRVSTISLEKIGKRFRKESIAAEKGSRPRLKKKKRKISKVA